jgi:hypothetical protein
MQVARAQQLKIPVRFGLPGCEVQHEVSVAANLPLREREIVEEVHVRVPPGAAAQGSQEPNQYHQWAAS